MLLALIVGCAVPPIEPEGSVELAGVPTGMTLDAGGRPLVVHRDEEGQCCRLAGFEPTLDTQLFDVGAGPGTPRARPDRTWYALRTGFTALDPNSADGAEVLWSTVFDAPVVVDGPAVALSDGTVVLAANDAGDDLLTSGVNARIIALDRFGALRWEVVFGGVVVGALRAAEDDLVYVVTEPVSGAQQLHAVSPTGTVQWSNEGGGLPLIPLDDGLLVARAGLLARLDATGEDVWVSAAPVAVTSVDARQELTATRTALDQIWVTAPGQVTSVDLATGSTLLTFDATCGPLVAGTDVALWGFCETETPGRIALHSISGFAVQQRGVPVAGQAVGGPTFTPVEDGVGLATAYGLFTGPLDAPQPQLVRYPGATNIDPDAPWGSPYGAGNTGSTTTR